MAAKHIATKHITTKSVFLAASLVTLATAASAQQAKRTTVTVALSSAGFSIGNLRLAEQAGFFANHGVDAKFVVMDSGNAAAAALISGSAEFVASGPATAIAARARQQALVCTANIYRGLSASLALSSTTASKLNVSPKAPIADRLRALQGLVIAFPSATSAFFGPIKHSTDAMAIAPKFSFMAQPAMPAALSAGAIQGMMAGPTTILPSIQAGAATLWIDGPGAELPAEYMPTSSSCLLTTEQFARKHVEVVKAMRAALNDVAALVKSDPAKARAYLAAAFPKIDAKLLEALFSAESGSWTQTEFSVSDIQQEIRLLKAGGGQIPGIDKIDPQTLLFQP